MWSKRIKGIKEEKCCRVGSLKKMNDQYTFLAKVARKGRISKFTKLEMKRKLCNKYQSNSENLWVEHFEKFIFQRLESIEEMYKMLDVYEPSKWSQRH